MILAGDRLGELRENKIKEAGIVMATVDMGTKPRMAPDPLELVRTPRPISAATCQFTMSLGLLSSLLQPIGLH